MTVAELIAKLQTLPADVDVEVVDGDERRDPLTPTVWVDMSRAIDHPHGVVAL